MKKIASQFAKTTLVALIMCSLVTSSCKKPEKGDPGKDGNANVKSSTVTVTNWTYAAPSYYVDITYPAITSSIINSGAVLVYVSNGSGGYTQLPITFFTSSSYSSSLEVVSFPGGIRIYRTDSDLTQPSNPGSQTFKIVVIEASGITANPDVDLNNYAEVKAAFNLND